MLSNTDTHSHDLGEDGLPAHRAPPHPWPLSSSQLPSSAPAPAVPPGAPAVSREWRKPRPTITGTALNTPERWTLCDRFKGKASSCFPCSLAGHLAIRGFSDQLYLCITAVAYLLQKFWIKCVNKPFSEACLKWEINIKSGAETICWNVVSHETRTFSLAAVEWNRSLTCASVLLTGSFCWPEYEDNRIAQSQQKLHAPQCSSVPGPPQLVTPW